MRRLISSLAALAFAASLILLAARPVAAQQITVRIDPPVITRGGGFVLTAAGLIPNERYTFDFVFVPTGQVVFTTDRVADPLGSIALSIRSDDTDELGDYRVDIRLNRVVVAEATFTLVAADAPPTPTPSTQATPQPPLTGSNVTVTVRPTEGRVRQDFQITVRGLEPRTVNFVTVREAATNVVVYDRERTSDANGELSVTLFTTAENTPGEYLVEVSDNRGVVLATTTFQLLGVGGRDAVLTITRRPTDIPTFDIVITNAAQFTDITIDIIDPDTRRSIFQRIVRTNVDGTARTEFTLPADLPLKPFDVVLTDIEGEITRGTIPTGPAPSPFELSISARPESGIVGQVFNISANGLPLAERATIRILRDGEIVATYTPRINRRGSTTVTVASADLAPGVYVAEVEVEGEVLLETSFEVRSVTVPPTIVIDPPSGPRGTTHRIVVDNLPPDTVVTFEVLFDGLPVLTTSRRADSSGQVTLELTSEPRDAVGEYTVRVITGDAEVNGTFTVLADVPEPPLVTGDGRITITPPSGPEGTSHLVEVTDLPANTPLTVQVTFGGEVVFSADRVSDAEGNFSIRLITEPTDPAGVYNVEIVIAGEVVARAPLTLLRATVLPLPIAPDGALPLPPNERETTLTEGQLTADMPSEFFDLEGRMGDLVVISLQSNDFDAFLVLRDSSGTEIASNDDSDGLNSRIVAVLPSDGTFTIEVTSFGNRTSGSAGTGRYTLSIERVMPLQVSPNTPVQVDFGLSDAYYLSAEMMTDRRYTLRGFGGDTDTDLEVFSPLGASILYDDDSGSGLDPEVINFRPFEPGTHIIVFGRVEAEAGGLAVFELAEAVFPALEAGPATVQLNSKLTTDGVTFDGVGGTIQNIRLDFISGSATSVTVEAIQNGSTLMSFSSNSGVVPTLTLPVVVPVDGRVTVFVSTFSGTSTYTVQLD
ncbi:MAG: PPC domain-containing protein [Anaerolinea sp.]